ncbi:helix-turn-helix domain-containing protein [Wukongibacter baidiensis]|uniref:DUF6597 domain-containing transcriptional factor n=1 Tax=Wukongibacter baidiensis TaxID=1723361 RepID=UPI003D7F827F
MKPKYLNAILKINELNKNTSFNVFTPSDDLRSIIDLFWSVKWNLPNGTEFKQQIIPNPHINIVNYGDGTFVEGVVKKLFEYNLRGNGEILGIKFRIGTFNNFTNEKMSTFTNRKIGIGKVLNSKPWSKLNNINNTQSKIEHIEDILRGYPRQVDDKRILAEEIVNFIRVNNYVSSVGIVADNFAISVRSIQRIFDKYLGVNPKWVIRMFRLQELKKEIESNNHLDWADLAAKLEYSDQSHMINDFKSILNITPEEYNK